MSGEKCAETRLAAEREAALRHQRSVAAELSRIQADGMRRTGEYETFRDEYSRDAARAMPEDLAVCAAAAARLREDTAALGDLAKQAQGMSLGRTNEEVSRFEAELHRIEQAGQGLAQVGREAADALERGMETIRQNIQARLDAVERERRVQADRQTRLRVQRETLAAQARIDPALARVAQAVGEVLDATADPAHLEESDVATLAQRIETLRQDAWERDLGVRRQQHIADLLRGALAEAGFTKRQDDWVEEAGAGEVHLQHDLSGAEIYVRVSTRIPEDQSIHLLMEGAAGSNHEHLEPAPFCGDSLDAVITRAKELGLIIGGVTVKGPDGFWRAWETADEAEQRRLAESDAAAEHQRLQTAASGTGETA